MIGTPHIGGHGTHQVDNFDRSVQPIARNPEVARVPDYYTQTFENQLKLIGTEYSEVPIMRPFSCDSLSSSSQLDIKFSINLS